MQLLALVMVITAVEIRNQALNHLHRLNSLALSLIQPFGYQRAQYL